MATLIVADDDDEVRELLTFALTHGGYKVLAARDGQEGWEFLQTNDADGMVLDVNMPRMDGLELCRKIRESAQFSRMPILLLTIKKDIKDQLKGFDCGADEYLAKPFDHNLLLARVKALLERSKKTA
jgi:two-component system response regulator MprA